MTGAPPDVRDDKTLRAELRRLTNFEADPQAECTVIRERDLGSHRLEELRLGQKLMAATLSCPNGAGPFPAVLYCHGQSSDTGLGRRELIDGSSHLQAPGYGPALANMGFASLSIDLPGFGARQHEPRTLDRMLNDLSAARGYLATRADIDSTRLFVLGHSMGAALAFWLAALDRRITGCVQLCILADRAPLIDCGVATGPWFDLPRLAELCEIGDIAGLVAPRAQLICHGANDPRTPPKAREAALSRVQAAYDGTNALECLLDGQGSHSETAAMRVAVLDFLARAAAHRSPFST